MSHITLTEEQARAFVSSRGTIEMRDSSGKSLGVVTNYGWTAEELAAAKQAAIEKRPGLTTEQMIDYLRSLKRP